MKRKVTELFSKDMLNNVICPKCDCEHWELLVKGNEFNLLMNYFAVRCINCSYLIEVPNDF